MLSKIINKFSKKEAIMANQNLKESNTEAPQKEKIRIITQPTPNPDAFKFVLNKDVKSEGNATFRQQEEAESIELANELFNIAGVEQVHFYENVITISLNSSIPLSELRDDIETTIQNFIHNHNPDFQTEDDIKRKSRDDLPEDIQQIETILDNTIRPGLQGDGGDIEIIDYQDHELSIRYQGACGSCPSSLMGTLQAITQILRDEFDPEIEVIPV